MYTIGSNYSFTYIMQESEIQLYSKLEVKYGLDPLKMRTPCNGDFFTPNSVIKGGQTDARC